jgi:hypothetical protein
MKAKESIMSTAENRLEREAVFMEEVAHNHMLTSMGAEEQFHKRF